MTRALAVALVLALATLALYAPVGDFDFVGLDDQAYVAQNPVVREGLSLRGLRWAFASPGAAGNWHPLTWLSHQLDVTLFGLDAGRHHLVNALLHAAAAAAIVLALHAATGALWASALVGALFAVHPLHVESVAWVAERKDVLAALLGFAAAGAWVRYARRPVPATYAAALGLFALGLLAKPTLVTLPVLLLALDWWPLGRLRTDPRRALADKVPLLALSAVASALTWVAQSHAGAITLLDASHLPLRLANALLAYQRYLGALLWPSGLAVSYPYPTAFPAAWRLIAAAALLVALSAGALAARRRAPWALAGWAWFLVALLPTIGIVKIGAQAYADRYAYLPLVGGYAAIAWTLRAAARRLAPGPARLVPALTAVLALLVLVPVTRAQLATWRSDETLLARVAEVSPDSLLVRAAAEYRAGLALARAGQYAEARARLGAALRLRPRMPEARNTLGAVLLLEGRPAEAEQHLRAGLAINPLDPDLRANLATALRRQGRDAEAEALEAARTRD